MCVVRVKAYTHAHHSSNMEDYQPAEQLTDEDFNYSSMFCTDYIIPLAELIGGSLISFLSCSI